MVYAGPPELSILRELTGASQHELRRVIDVFRKPSRSFLMPPIHEPLHEDSVIDISHESLMRMWTRLDNWADEEAESTQIYLRLSETAVLHSEGRAGLWRDPDLQRALEWRQHNNPNKTWASRISPGFDQAMKFLDDSRAASDFQKANELKAAEQERELERSRAITEEQYHRLKAQSVAARRLKQVIGLVSGGLIVTLFLSAFSYYQYRTAATQTTLAEHKTRMAAEAESTKATVVENLVNKTAIETRLLELTQDFQKITERMWLAQSGADIAIETVPAAVTIDNQSSDALLLFLLDAEGVQSEPRIVYPDQQSILEGVIDQVWMARSLAAAGTGNIEHFGILSRPDDTFTFKAPR